MILLYELKDKSILDGIKNRLMRSWRSKRGKIPTRRSYTLEAGNRWDIALEQLQKLLPVKKTDETFRQENTVTDNGSGSNLNRDGQKPQGDLDKCSDSSKETVDQHSSKPTIYI